MALRSTVRATAQISPQLRRYSLSTWRQKLPWGQQRRQNNARDWEDSFDMRDFLLPITSMMKNDLTDVFQPRLDLVETDKEYCVNVELPGIAKEDIKVEMHGDNMTISAQSQKSDEFKGAEYYRADRRYGTYFASIALPKGMEADQIKSTLKHGVLEVRMPKGDSEKEEKPTSIPIQMIE